MRVSLILVILFSCLLQMRMGGQNQNNKWFFGNLAGLDFSTSPPTSITGSINTLEGTVAIANNSGSLLFYSDGATIYNQNHQVMSNGSGINCHGSPVQPAIIIKQPGSNNLYYVFTIGLSSFVGGLNYSIIDMSLSAGTGSVVTKNMVLSSNSNILEKLTATKHCNGSDYWIITKLQNSNSFHVFLLTSSGVSSTPIISSIGPVSNLTLSQLKVSANGRKVVNTEMPSATTTYFDITLYDFDNSTGQLSNPQTFPCTPNAPLPSATYGTEFSPDGTKLYISTYYNSNTNPMNFIFQWDLCSGLASSIASTQIQVASVNGPTQMSALQLGPDNKIYVARANQTALGVINNPNATGTACNYVHQGPSVSPNVCRMGLPNQIPNFQRPALPAIVPAVSSQQCQTASFNSPLLIGGTIGTCPANTYTLQSLLWNFGDPLSGSANTSTSSSPSHQFTSVGTYSVKLILDFGCGGGVDTLKQVVNIGNSCFSINSTSITCATLGSATVTPPPTGIAYSYTWLPTAQNGSVAVGLNPGTYTLLAFDPLLNFTHAITTTFNSLIPLSGSVNTSSSVTCNAAATGTGQVSNLLGGSGNQSYLWSNGSASYTTAYTNSLSAGIWSVNVSDALTGCQINQSFFISQPPALVLTLSSTTPSACVNASAALSGTTAGGTPAYTYTWSNAVVSYSSVVSQTLAGTYVYTLSSTDANTCLVSNTIALAFIANPILSVSDVSICPLKTGTLSVTGASSYTWNNSSFGSTFSDSPLSNTAYTVKGSALACTSIATASIILHASPVPVLQTNSPRCEGSSGLISVSGGTGAIWSGPNVFSSNNLSHTLSSIGLANAGVYSTTITSAQGCTATSTTTFVVNPTPTLSASGSTVCTTQTLSLFANALVGSTYLWTGPNNYSSLVQNPTLLNPALNRTGTYAVTVTAPTSCTNTAIAQVSVTAPPSLSLALSSASLCYQAFNGSPNTITLTSAGANSYTLYTPNLVGSSSPVGPTSSLTAIPPYSSSMSIGSATLEGSNGVCSAFSTFIFTVIPNPTVGVNSYTPVICAGQNFTYTSNGASSYVWSASSPNYTSYSNGGVAVAHPSVNAVFSVYGSSLGCQSALVSSSITVYPLPTMTLSARSSSICLYDKTTLSVSGTGTSYQWLPMSGLSAYTGSLVNCATPVNQVYTVIATANNCTAAASSSVQVWPLPSALILTTKNKVCLNDTFVLTGSGGIDFNWQGPGSVQLAGPSVSLRAYSPALAGTYTLTVTDANACKHSATTQMDILALPEGLLKNFKEEVCAPYCGTFNFIGLGNDPIQTTWRIGQTFFTQNSFQQCFKESGTYTINGTLINTVSGCKSSQSYQIKVYKKPKADFEFLPAQPLENLDEVIFTNTSQGEGPLVYHWYFNDHKGFITSIKDVTYLYSEPGEYKTVLVTKNKFGCADTILKPLSVAADFALYVPNAFTPNNDQNNDVFLPVLRSYKFFDLKIYDRWGQELFHSSSAQTGWDGTYKAEPCKEDTYTWVIELSTSKGEKVSKSGVVVLVR